MSFNESQLRAIEDTERACSALSLVGTSAIIGTFLASRSFRKPINRLVFYASWGNILSNVATLISRSGILHGIGSPLCQFQGFLIQWFMPADAMWTLTMACNVYLTFFHKYDSAQLRKLEWKYLLICYGLPFIPAFAYFFISSEGKGKVYGSAILWCWVSLPWDALRIAVFYGPVWFIIVITLAIYISAGKVIFEKRRELQQISTPDASHLFENPFEGTSKVTEIFITSEPADLRRDSRRLGHSTEDMSQRAAHMSPFSPYTVTIETGEAGNSFPLKALGNQSDPNAQRRAAAIEANRAAWKYCKCAVLFFIALLVTWVPSTVNRVYSLARPVEDNFGLNYASGFVLPLQGFWNSLIYLSISWPARFRRRREYGRAREDCALKAGPRSSGSSGNRQLKWESSGR
ncbi:hypothetical protein VTN02DRAFT_3163 [Thermoascus thermophilus]